MWIYYSHHHPHIALRDIGRRRTKVGGGTVSQLCLAGRTSSGSSFSEAESNPYRVTPNGELKKLACGKLYYL